jgi:hypothetical protein
MQAIISNATVPLDFEGGDPPQIKLVHKSRYYKFIGVKPFDKSYFF